MLPHFRLISRKRGVLLRLHSVAPAQLKRKAVIIITPLCLRPEQEGVPMASPYAEAVSKGRKRTSSQIVRRGLINHARITGSYGFAASKHTVSSIAPDSSAWTLWRTLGFK